jgi:hypothetical protein
MSAFLMIRQCINGERDQMSFIAIKPCVHCFQNVYVLHVTLETTKMKLCIE